MTRTTIRTCSLICALALAGACGDDDDGATPPDAQVGTVDAPVATVDAPAAADADTTDAATATIDATAAVEACDNELDDDMDGHADCADSDCVAFASCAITPQTIQEVQDGTVATGKNVSISKVYVTGVRVNASGSVNAFVQTADGVTSGGHTYPEYAGLQLFIAPAEAAAFPGFATMVVGDCISFTGTTFEFQMDTELLSMTAFTAEDEATCGTAPTPLTVPAGALTFDSFATDSDVATMGDQPGANAELYEGVLVKVEAVTALTATDAMGQFRVTKVGGGAATLQIGKFMFLPVGTPVPATVGQMFTSITGIYAQRMNYQLLPRGMADLQ